MIARLARRLRLFALGLCAVLSIPTALHAAVPACVDPGGIGGTGISQRSGGAGGTGISAQDGGTGGTGRSGQSGGTGGTGMPAAQDGIGGTGAPLAQAPGGIGGTGIVGTITGFASICVNGVKVNFEPSVGVTENGLPARAERLAIGQVVAIEAQSSTRGLEARAITILHAYEGPLTALESDTAPLRVMGQPVRIAIGAIVDEGLRTGDAVRVSGLRNARGEVVATRIDRAPDLLSASAIGTLDDAQSLHGLALARTTGSEPAPTGREVLVRGLWTGERLIVTDSRTDPSIPFAGRVSRAIVEGLVHHGQAERVTIGGFSVVLGAGTEFQEGIRGDLRTDQRVRISGVFSGSRELTATHVEFVRTLEDVPRTRLQMRSNEDGGDAQESGRTRVETDDEGRTRIRIESESTRLKLDRSVSDGGDVRERIDLRIEGPSGELERRERIETREIDGRIETRERIEIFDGGTRVERIDRIDRVDKIENPERPERPEKLERPERPERPEKLERPERPERPEKLERPERPEKLERLERPDRL